MQSSNLHPVNTIDWHGSCPTTAHNTSNNENLFVNVLKLTVKPDSLDFGQVGLGQVKTRKLEIVSMGTSRFEVYIPSPPRASSFRWQAVEKRALEPVDRLEFDVSFLPLQAGNFNQTLSIESNVPGSPYAIQLRGKGSGSIPE
jgi:hypothetical protein